MFIQLQVSQETYNAEVQRLTDENEALRNHLRDVVHSSLSDSEKQKIIQESQRLHNSAPASIAMPIAVSISRLLCVVNDYDDENKTLPTSFLDRIQTLT